VTVVVGEVVADRCGGRCTPDPEARDQIQRRAWGQSLVRWKVVGSVVGEASVGSVVGHR
jgi:hypothetical protein